MTLWTSKFLRTFNHTNVLEQLFMCITYYPIFCILGIIFSFFFADSAHLDPQISHRLSLCYFSLTSASHSFPFLSCWCLWASHVLVRLQERKRLLSLWCLSLSPVVCFETVSCKFLISTCVLIHEASCTRCAGGHGAGACCGGARGCGFAGCWALSVVLLGS